MTTPTQIRIDMDIKKEATELFKTLGLDMSSAINLFLHQCVLTGGIPFEIKTPKYSKKLLKAAKEAIEIENDPNTKGYTSIEELHEALDK